MEGRPVIAQGLADRIDNDLAVHFSQHADQVGRMADRCAEVLEQRTMLGFLQQAFELRFQLRGGRGCGIFQARHIGLAHAKQMRRRFLPIRRTPSNGTRFQSSLNRICKGFV